MESDNAAVGSACEANFVIVSTKRALGDPW